MFAAIQAADLAAVGGILEQHPASARARNPQGLTPVMLAAYMRQGDVLALLLAHRDDLDLFEAAAVGQAPRIAALLDSGEAQVSAYAPDGFTALHLAAFFGHADALRALLERGADVAAVTRNDLANQPLHAAAAGGDVRLCNLLIAAGADVDAKQHGGYTPLHEAAQSGNLEMVDAFLAAGADPILRDDEGRTAADLAAQQGHAAIASLLRRA
jgi:ankyrin repeat protein